MTDRVPHSMSRWNPACCPESMSLPTPEFAFSVTTQSLAAAREEPGAATPLPEALQATAQEPNLRLRTGLLADALEVGLDTGEAADWICNVWRASRAGDRGALRCLVSLLE